MSIGLLYALCNHAIENGIRCGFCVPRPQLLKRWMQVRAQAGRGVTNVALRSWGEWKGAPRSARTQQHGLVPDTADVSPAPLQGTSLAFTACARELPPSPAFVTVRRVHFACRIVTRRAFPRPHPPDPNLNPAPPPHATPSAGRRQDGAGQDVPVAHLPPDGARLRVLPRLHRGVVHGGGGQGQAGARAGHRALRGGGQWPGEPGDRALGRGRSPCFHMSRRVGGR